MEWDSNVLVISWKKRLERSDTTLMVMCAHWDDQRRLTTGGEQISKNDPKMSGVHSGGVSEAETAASGLGMVGCLWACVFEWAFDHFLRGFLTMTHLSQWEGPDTFSLCQLFLDQRRIMC